MELANNFKMGVGLTIISIVLIALFNPWNVLYKRVRYSTIEAFFNVFIAPFGNVKFKAYILAEILTDCIVPLEDVGKLFTHVVTGDWNVNLIS